jgi:ParB-like chromosome segregation protein Spo0J
MSVTENETQLMEIFELVLDFIDEHDLEEKISLINFTKKELHKISPFRKEPTDLVIWEKSELVQANSYNPNSVAPVEMELLRLSITADGYTQPVVTWNNGDNIEVIDGFHRNRVAKECEDVRDRVHGYLPIVSINSGREDQNDRMASTIRHNRARGKHKIDAMSDIVRELKRRCWKDAKISKELGMDSDEVLRLAQITGLADAFGDREFSESWEADVEQQEMVKDEPN